MKRSTLIIPLAALSCALPASVPAAITLGFDPGTQHVVQPAMEDFATLGSQMAGMQMTVVQGGVSQVHTSMSRRTTATRSASVRRRSSATCTRRSR